jgi:hypothetical protein
VANVGIAEVIVPVAYVPMPVPTSNLERMVVAACAFNLQAEQELADVHARLFRRDLPAHEVEIRDAFEIMPTLATSHPEWRW